MAQLFNKRYEIHEKLGEGGMGAVYRALDRLTGEMVALKFVLSLHPSSPSDSVTENADFRLSLAREFKVLASLRHPHIIKVLDYGFGSFNNLRQPYIAMELLTEAREFTEYGDGLETLEAKIELALQLLQALAYMHRRNLLHRDLKPGNVLMTSTDQLKVLDFGLAIETGMEDLPAGTLLYMAPELLNGASPSVSSDLYAVGVMVYELLTGHNPFSREAAWQTINAVLNDEPDFRPVEALATRRGTQLKPTVRHTVDDSLDKTIVAPDSPQTQATPDPTLVHRAAETAKADAGASTAVPRQFETTEIGMIGGTALPDILARLLTKQPENRYQTAESVIEALCMALELPLPEETAAIRESFLQAATFVGRETELAKLTVALRDIVATPPIGAAWLIGGESGIGKSRLLEELRIQATVRGIPVIRGEIAVEDGAPYQLWREPLRRVILISEPDALDSSILKDLIPDIEMLLGRPVPDAVKVESTAYQQRLHGTIASLFQRQTEPLVLLLEDLHLASAENIELLKVVNRLAGRLPLLILATYRNDEQPALAETLSDMQAVKLERLTTTEVMQLSRSMLGEVGERADILDLLLRQSEGNIFFMIEIARALSEEAGSLSEIRTMALPQTIASGGIQAVIARRLAQIPAVWQPLLQLAAVAGRRLDVPVLKRIASGIDLEKWLIDCTNAAVFQLYEGEWRFAYDRLRETVLAEIDHRPALHRQIAEAMEQVYPDAPEQAALLAHHWEAAGDMEKEFIYTRKAADYALKISVFADAVEHLTRALGLVRAITLENRQRDLAEAEILVRLGETLYYMGDYASATTRLEASLRLYRTVNNDQQGTARALNALSDTRWRLGTYAEAVEACEAALTISRAVDDQPSIARALNRLGMVLIEQGSYPDAAERLTESVRVARALHAPGLIINPVNNLAVVAFAQGDYDSAERYLEETLALSRISGERYKTAAVLANLGGVAGSREDFPKAMGYFEESLRISQSIGYRHGVAFALKNLGILAEMQHDYPTAEYYLKQGLELSQSIGERQSSAMTLISLGEVSHLRHDAAAALDYYRQALRLAREIDALPTIMDAFVGLAKLTDHTERALQLLSLVIHHTATVEDTRRLAEPTLEELKRALPEEQIAAALERGKAMDVWATITQILEQPL